MLRIYATVYNNADLVERSIASLTGLGPHKLYVVDNFSSDGTYEKLTKHGDIAVKRAKCSRGKGRDIALRMLLDEAKDDDPVMYTDLDTSYSKAYIQMVLRQVPLLRHGELRMLFIGLSTAKTNRNLFWRDLNVAEDWERLARAKASGIRLVDVRRMWQIWRDYRKEWISNRSGVGFRYSERERRYSGNALAHRVRMFKLLIDYERGVAFRRFDEFYDKAAVRNPISLAQFVFAFYIAKVLGVYSYSKKLNNKDYTLGFKTSVRRRF